MQTNDVSATLAAAPGRDRDGALRQAAISLEATFLAEMLSAAGLGETRSDFGGGAGEDQFQSVLVRAEAEQIARAGGIGLAELLFHALKEAEHAK